MSRHWTQDELDELAVLVRRGGSILQIAVEMDRTPGSIAGQLSRLRDLQLPPYDNRSRKIADGFTEEESREIVERYETGWQTFAGIARHMGLPSVAVEKHYRSLARPFSVLRRLPND